MCRLESALKMWAWRPSALWLRPFQRSPPAVLHAYSRWQCARWHATDLGRVPAPTLASKFPSELCCRTVAYPRSSPPVHHLGHAYVLGCGFTGTGSTPAQSGQLCCLCPPPHGLYVLNWCLTGLACEWHPTLNGSLTPSCVKPHTYAPSCLWCSCALLGVACARRVF